MATSALKAQQVGIAVTLYTRSREMFSSNLDRDADYTEVLRVFIQPLQAYAGIVPRSVRDLAVQPCY
jgi:hypothetical protein